MKKNTKGPKVLLVDIETAPLLGYVWSLWNNDVGLNQVKSDWHLLSWAAKWLDDPADRIMYQDQRNAKKLEDDFKLLEGIWKLLDEADIIITQNGRDFDAKKLNARFIINGFKPPSSYKHIDTKVIAKKYFAFTSNKLEYLSDKLNKKYKKLKHEKFSGFELWSECLNRNKEAWKELEKYNKYDVLALEELYKKISPWDSGINFNLYSDEIVEQCSCGSVEIISKGYYYTSTGKFSRHICKECGKSVRGKTNLFSKEKKKSLKINTSC